jgi:hypothetical protein
MKTMNTVRLLKLLSFGILAAGTCFGASDRLPDFSWDTVPRYMHVRKITAFTPEEAAYLASFPLVTFEKTTGMKEFGSTEAGTLQAAEAVKRINPRVKILYYRNILVHYAMYDADKQLAAIPNPFLVDQKGNTKLVRGKVPAYDLSNEAIQSWWLDHAKKVCASEYIDGFFVDGNIKVLEQAYLRKSVGEKKKSAVEKAYHRMMKKLPGTLGSDQLVLANIIRARFDKAGLEYLGYFDGSYIEGFEHAVGGMSRADYMAKGIAAIQTAARKGKIIAFTIGMGENNDTALGIDESRSSVSNSEAVRQRFIYSLALFLVCAEKQSYFMPSNGYGVDGGSNPLWMYEFPEYAYPLGAPKGRAVKKGTTYRREFKHARVRVDIQTEKAEIIWHKK